MRGIRRPEHGINSWKRGDRRGRDGREKGRGSGGEAGAGGGRVQEGVRTALRL